MSVATFSPPIKATVNSSSLPCIVIGVFREASETVFIAIDTDGRSVELRAKDFTFDFRYDIAAEIWDDPGAKPDDDLGDDD